MAWRCDIPALSVYFNGIRQKLRTSIVIVDLQEPRLSILEIFWQTVHLGLLHFSSPYHSGAIDVRFVIDPFFILLMSRPIPHNHQVMSASSVNS
jgi:hypothetical protein